MSELISGKEALIALANGEEVEYMGNTNYWYSLNKETFAWTITEVLDSIDMDEGTNFKFRLKPRTITINGVEIPAPFEPKDGELFYYINSSSEVGYSEGHTTKWSKYLQFGAWRKEGEIKQVVEVLRKVFNSQ